MKRAALVMIGSSVMIVGCDRIPGTEAHTIAKGEDIAAAALIDPSSAQFRKTRLVIAPPKPNDATDWPRRVVCGEINGKNRQGAYTGFSRFLADPDLEDGYYLEPLVSSSEEERDREQRACQRAAQGPIYSEIEREIGVMQCQRASEIAEEFLALAEFEVAYATFCEAEKSANDAPTSTLDEPTASAPKKTD